MHSYNFCNCFLHRKLGLDFGLGIYSVSQQVLFTETCGLRLKLKKLRVKQFQISFVLRLLLEKVAIIPKSQLPKLTEAWRNVPTETKYVSS